MLEKSILSPHVSKAVHEEHEKIRAEIREKGPAFDFPSINGRFQQVATKAAAEEVRTEETDSALPDSS